MNRERNALPPPPPHPARLAKSPSYYLPPRIPGQNMDPQFSSQSHMNNVPQQSQMRQPAYQQYQYSNVPNQIPQTYASQQSAPLAYNPSSQPRSPSIHPYQSRSPQPYSPQHPMPQQAHTFPHQSNLPPAPSIQSSFSLPPAIRKSRPESMPPLPSSSIPTSGLPSYLPPPTAVNNVPSISTVQESLMRNATSTGRRPLPTPSPTRTSPTKLPGTTISSDPGLNLRQNSLPLVKNEAALSAQSLNSRRLRALPTSPISPKDSNKLPLGNSTVILGDDSQMERKSTVASMKAKFEGNFESSANFNHINNSSYIPSESPALQKNNATEKNGILLSGNITSRSPSPLSPQYGILDLPSRSRSHSASIGRIPSPSQQVESVVYAPSPVRAQRALQSSEMEPKATVLDRGNENDTYGQMSQRPSNIYKLASLSLDDELKEVLCSEDPRAGSYANPNHNAAPRNIPYISEPTVMSDVLNVQELTSHGAPSISVIHAPPTQSGSNSNRPVITLTPKALVDRDFSDSFDKSRQTPFTIPSISLPEADDDFEDVAHHSARSQNFYSRPASTSSTNPGPLTFRGSSPNNSKRSLPQPPPSPQKQHYATNTYDQRSRPRGGGLVCGGCGQNIVGRIVSAMSRRWHPQCFKCADCGELLEHVSAYEHDGQPYCHLDYHERFAPKCYHCKTAIVDERFITLDDPALGKRAYHEQHFFCAECGDPFLTPSISRKTVRKPGEISVSGDGEFDLDEDDVGFTVYKGHPYCEACHVRLRMPKCKKCKKSIRPGMHALEALGGKWCWECFVCAVCEKPFQNPSFFQRDQKPYCEPCFSIMLRNEI